MGDGIGGIVNAVLLCVGGLCVLLIVIAVFVCLLRNKPLSVSGPKLFLVLLFVCLTFGVVPKSLEFFGMTAALEQKDKEVAHVRAALAASTGMTAENALTETVVDNADADTVSDLVEEAGGENDG